MTDNTPEHVETEHVETETKIVDRPGDHGDQETTLVNDQDEKDDDEPQGVVE
jgi:hypothetical protein